MSDSITSNSPLVMLGERASSPAAIKFGLFVKNQEIHQIEASLRHVTLMSNRDKQLWLSEHETFVNDLLDNFVEDSTLALDGLQLDGEALQLSIEFVSGLRNVMNTIRSLFNDNYHLPS